MRSPALLSLLLWCGLAGAAPAAQTESLSLTRLYSLPWVVGTTPEKPTWSADSQHLAFLWNDDGSNTRDVWWTDTSGRPVARLTDVRHGQPGLDTDPGVTTLAFAADGQSVLYVRSGVLHQRSLSPSGEQTVLDDHSGGVHEISAIRGTTLAVYAHAHGLSVVDYATPHSTRELVHLPADVGIDTLKVSPDGRYVAFLETDLRAIPERLLPDYLTDETTTSHLRRAFPGEPSEHYRVGVVPITGGLTVWLDLEGNPEDLVFSIAWAPDGHAVLVDRADLYIKHRRLRVIDPVSGHGRTVYEEGDPSNVTAEWWADWSTDGQSVYFTSDRGEDYQLWQLPLDGSPIRPLTPDGEAVFSAATVPGRPGVLLSTNRTHPEDRGAYWWDGHDSVRALLTTAGYHEALVSPDGRWVADLHSDDVTPPELYLAPFATPIDPTQNRRLTHSPLPPFEQYPWAKARYVEFANVHDGTRVHARLTLPPDFDPHRRYPAILGSVYSNTVHNRWGGRVYHPTWALDQYLARHGYVIMNVDISGSSGHGKAFRQRIREDYGGIDVEDLYSATRYLIGTGYVDEHRIGIWGSSYGGLLTTMSLFKHPGVYAAGVAGAPATNVFHAETGEMRTMMDPRSREARYRAASPYLFSDGLADPLLIIHGMRDDTVLFKDTLALTQRLILADKDVELAVLPDAPHGWDTQGLAQTRYAFRRLVEFFDRHLKPTTSTNAQGPSR